MLKNELFVFGLIDFSHPKTLLWEPANTEEKSKHKAAKHKFRFIFFNVTHPHLGFHNKIQVWTLIYEIIKCWHFQFL